MRFTSRKEFSNCPSTSKGSKKGRPGRTISEGEAIKRPGVVALVTLPHTEFGGRKDTGEHKRRNFRDTSDCAITEIHATRI